MLKWKNIKRHILAPALFIAMFTLTGCAEKYILVRSEVSFTSRNENSAEVTTTPRYNKIISNVNSVALNAPSSCANSSAAAATGKAEGRGDIIKTRCGVEMAEIERALVRQGLTVYSWNVLNDAMKGATSPLDVAKRLGAQVLFQVNSLERVELNPSGDYHIKRTFYKSNYNRETQAKIQLDEKTINNIKSVISENEAVRLADTKRLGAMLDINAVDTETGQTIWFYSMTNQNDTSTYYLTESLVYCSPLGCHEIKKDYTETPQISGNKMQSGEMNTLEINARPNNEQDAIYFALLRSIIADFVKKFTSAE